MRGLWQGQAYQGEGFGGSSSVVGTWQGQAWEEGRETSAEAVDEMGACFLNFGWGVLNVLLTSSTHAQSYASLMSVLAGCTEETASKSKLTNWYQFETFLHSCYAWSSLCGIICCCQD